MANINDDYEKYLREEKSKQGLWAKFSKQIKPIHIIGIFLVLFIGHYFNTRGNLPQYFFISIIILIFLVLYFMKRNIAPSLIPEHVIKQIAQESLEKKRRLGIEIPFESKVRVLLVGEIIYEQDIQNQTSGVIKREVGFQIETKGLKKTGVIGVHPYNGTILGIRWERTGYTGKETKDKQIVPVGVLDNLKTASEYPIG